MTADIEMKRFLDEFLPWVIQDPDRMRAANELMSSREADANRLRILRLVNKRMKLLGLTVQHLVKASGVS